MQLETIQLGVNTTVIGMGVVFSVLIILSFTTWLLTTIVDGGAERKKARAAADAAQAEQEMAASTVPAAAGLSTATVAAIMAAVSAASGLPVSQLRFTAIRRANTSASAWSTSGAADIIANRQAYL